MYREINKRARAEFAEKIRAIPPESLVYVDECGVDQYLYREYAYAPRGQKVVAEISGKKFKRTNFAAGLCLGEWVAPIEYNSTTDSVLFEFWFEHCLLKALKPGSVIVLDNATFHRKTVLPGFAQRHGCNVLFCRRIRLTSTPSKKSGLGSKKDCAKSCRTSIPSSSPCKIVFRWFEYKNALLFPLS